MTYRFSPVYPIRIESLGEVWAAFSSVSGETVLLNDESASIIEVLESHGVSDAISIAHALAAACDLSQLDLEPRISGALFQLEKTGLVRRLNETHQSG